MARVSASPARGERLHGFGFVSKGRHLLVEGTHRPGVGRPPARPTCGLCLFPWFIGGRTSCCDLGSAGPSLVALVRVRGVTWASEKSRSSGRVGAAHPPRSVYGSLHPDTNFALVERYHRLLNELDPTLDLPTAEGEASDPRSADQAYEVATKWLIDKTRDTDMFQLLFKENVSYGFRRNLWGLKPLALPLAIVAAALCVACAWPPVGAVELDWAVACAVSIGLVVFWVGWVRPSWVRIPADAYADRLFEACERLQAS